MILAVNEVGLLYRLCAAGDLPAIHAMLRGSGPGFAAIQASVVRQLDADDGDDYRTLAVGTRVLVATRSRAVCGMVKAVIASGVRWTATVEAWSAPPAGPEEAADFAGDALAWLHDLGVQAVDVKVHCRAFRSPLNKSVEVRARVVEWTADPIPLHPLGLPRELTWLPDSV